MSSPRAIGPYAVTGKLGEGGMGVVFRARHPNLPVEVAVKVLKASALDDEALARFRAEVLALARVKHENVVPVLDAGRAEDGSPYYVMPLVLGRSLESVVAKEGPLEPLLAAALVAKVARAVHVAHRDAAVIHRDLKPSNVLVDDASGEPKLFDFGVAKTGEGMGPRTETGVVVGTPEYMSPEQASGENALVDARTDVYGLGAILYALLTGKAPFERKGRPAALLLADVCLKDPAPVGSLRKGVARDLSAICEQAMAKERERRYASALELALDLERFGRGEPVIARPPGAGARLGRFVARHRAGVGVAATLVVLALGVATEEALRASSKSRELARQSEALATANGRLAVTKLLHDARALADAGAFFRSDGAPASNAPGHGAELRASLLEACRATRDDADRERAYPSVVEAIGLLVRGRCLDDARDELEHAEREFPDRVELLDAEHHLLRTSHRPCAPLHEKARRAASRRPIRRSFLSALDAETAYESGDLDRARALLDGAAKEPREPLAELVRGHVEMAGTLALVQVGVIAYTNALVGYPDDPESLAERASCLSRTFAIADGDRDADEALARDPKLHAALRVKAEVALMKCEWKRAEGIFRDWTTDAPDDAAGWAYLARVRALSGDQAGAIAAADKALACPHDARLEALALAARGAAHLGLREAVESDRDLRGSVVMAQKDTGSFTWQAAMHALLLAETGNATDARTELDRVSDRLPFDSPADPFVRLVLAHVCEALGSHTQAADFAHGVRSIYAFTRIPVPAELAKHLDEIEAPSRR